MMLQQHNTTTPPAPATAVVTVDPVSDEHRAMLPPLPATATHIVAARRGNELIAVELFSDAAGIPALQARAQQFAAHWGYAYFEPCSWCGINCAPTTRVAHEQLSRGSESSIRSRWAA
jgi:hypothetical protein